jgi:thymidylate synthase (FAD)
MKLINSSYEIIEPKSYDLGSVFKHIELCGRVCYHSYDKITPDSSTKFVDRMIKSGHTSVLEHGTIYLYREFELPAQNTTTSGEYHVEYYTWAQPYKDNPYSVVSFLYRKDGIAQVYVTTNYRVIVENALEDDLQYMVDQPMDGHERRYTVRFVCDRGVSHEFVRHRHFSFSQESTRYCNYSKDKFGNEITFIKPCFLDDSKLALYGSYHTVIRDKSPESIFIASLNNAEKDYIDLIELGWKPQEARAVLPNALKTELIMTGFASDWAHFFELRDDSRAHPDAQKLAKPLHEEFINRKYID